MDERMQFVARRLAGEPMAGRCKEFAISRKTGYKIFDRYQECGIQGLTDRSRGPYRYANQLPYILSVKHERPSWGLKTSHIVRWIMGRKFRRSEGVSILSGRSLERETVKIDSSSPFGNLVAERPKCCLGTNLPHLCWAGNKGCHQTDFIGLGGYTL